MKRLVIAFFIFSRFYSYSQNDTVVMAPEWYYGNKTFSTTVKQLQTYFTKPTTVMQFEKTLEHYQRQSTDTVFYANDSMKIIAVYYNIHDQSGKVDVITIKYNKKNKLTSLRFILEEDQIDIDKFSAFINQLTNAGYKKDLRYTRINEAFSGNKRRVFYKHPATKVNIGIYAVNEYEHSIEIPR